MLVKKSMVVVGLCATLVACGGGGGTTVSGAVDLSPPSHHGTQPRNNDVNNEGNPTDQGFLATLDRSIEYATGFSVKGIDDTGQTLAAGSVNPLDIIVDSFWNDVILATQIQNGQTQYMVYGSHAATVPTVTTEYDGKGYVITQKDTVPMVFSAVYHADSKTISGGVVKNPLPSASMGSDNQNNILITFSAPVNSSNGSFHGDATIVQYGGQPDWQNKKILVNGAFFGKSGVGGVLSSHQLVNPQSTVLTDQISGVFAGEANTPYKSEISQ